MIITVQISNYEQIRQKFSQAPFKMAQNISIAVERSIRKIEGTAKRESPVNKKSGGGNLRQSIRSQMIGIAKGSVEVGADYGIYVHEGTRPHIIRVRTKKVLADKRTGDIFGTVVNHPGTRANPFLQRAVDANRDFINNEFIQAIKNVL